MKRQVVRAGRVGADLVNGELRYVRFDGVEVVRRLSYAVRDSVWGTVPGTGSTCDVVETDDTFVVKRRAFHTSKNLAVVCDLIIRGTSHQISAELLAVAGAEPFDYARIGIVVLHPAAFAGSPIEIDSSHDGLISSALPTDVAPQLRLDGRLTGLFRPFTGLRIELPQMRVEHQFEGDIFELEDQRNWFDGSFKTYSTPLEKGWPHRSSPGQQIRQSVTVTCSGSRRAETRGLRILVGAATGRQMPAIGVGASGLVGAEVALRHVGPAHLRVDVDAEATTTNDDLTAAAAAGVPLELVVWGSAGVSLDTVHRQLTRHDVSLVRRVIAIETDRPVASSGWMRQLRSEFPTVPVLCGSDATFADINRERPSNATHSGLAFPLTCQVHQTDDDTLFEGLEGIAPAIATAVQLCAGREVAVSPVTLRPRRQEANSEVDDPQIQPDERHGTQLAAAWTMGCLAALAHGGATSATIFDASGPTGVTADGRLRPEGKSIAAVLAAARDLPDVFAVSVSEPRSLAALAIGKELAEVLFVANLTPGRLHVDCEVFGEGVVLGPYAVATLARA